MYSRLQPITSSPIINLALPGLLLVVGWQVLVPTVTMPCHSLESRPSPRTPSLLAWSAQVPVVALRGPAPHREETELGHSALWDILSCLYISAVTMASQTHSCLLHAVSQSSTTLVPVLVLTADLSVTRGPTMKVDLSNYVPYTVYNPANPTTYCNYAVFCPITGSLHQIPFPIYNNLIFKCSHICSISS